MAFRITQCLLAAIVVLVATTSVSAAVLTVPGQYATIGQALAAAGSGDTILVAPGTYPETINWPTVDGIRLIATHGPAQTSIDAQQRGRVITFPNGLTAATVLRGFTVTGGLMQTTRNHGAGIYVQSGPTIEGCAIQGNVGDGTSWNYGGGIHVTSSGSPRIIGNIIQRNILRNGSWNYGAGIYIANGGTALIMNNQIAANEHQMGSRGYGAGIYTTGAGTVVIVGNVIAQNRNASGLWNYGAGVYLDADALLVNNTIADNMCDTSSSFSSGGGLYHSATAATVAANNIVVRNSAAGGGGIAVASSAAAPPTLERNDVWQNTGGDYANATPGTGSVMLDPMFAGGYVLSASSPLIDQGDASRLPATVSTDVEGDARVLDGDLDGPAPFAKLDIGADEYAIGRLSISAPPQIGSSVTFDVAGPAGASWALLLSPTQANIVLQPFGNMLIGTPLLLLSSGPIPGRLVIRVPPVAALAGTSLFAQGAVALTKNNRTVGNTTNRLELTFFQ